MKNLIGSLLIAIITLTSTGFSSQALASKPKHSGVHYRLTNFRLTPKQFSKGYKAERREYRSIRENSTRQMLKRQKGTWFQRWYNRNF
jgi:hypothetical protein